MMKQLAEMSPLPFSERGLPSLPFLEKVLRRALSVKPEDRYGSVADFASALAECRTGLDETPSTGKAETSFPQVAKASEVILKQALLDGAWIRSGLPQAPFASVNYGAAGIAHSLHRISASRSDAHLLALADLWASRAITLSDSDDGFFNDEFDLNRRTVGESSLYHGPGGVFAVKAMVAWAMNDTLAHGEAIKGFLSTIGKPAAGLDLTLGRSGTLLGCALLLDTLRPTRDSDRGPLLQAGEATMHKIWSELDKQPPLEEHNVVNFGIAHGWAGYLYATLQWIRASAGRPPARVEERLSQLACAAEPVGRGLRWPWQIQPNVRQVPYMPGWCNGSSGYVFLWTLAYRMFQKQRYLDLARGAAWDVWDAPDRSASLCCGLVGRAYALLNLYKTIRDHFWLRRARELGRVAADEGQWEGEIPHSLYKGELSLPILAADLENPEEAALPMFEETTPSSHS